MVIRKEKTEEFSQIYDLVKVAFQTAKVTNGKEQDFVNQLRLFCLRFAIGTPT
ncbi:hypothetical protein Dtox_2751 [Desulfofarcimen acetoxidans DSM 771]|uniref:Uncharacterized protein n=1 Tax=Desulfofarcimen acetoxidans (strain ATCC 49208 / DSM 771 / KCTC 5769 / VKM B-1644 / 5575) TaxID=485916 RepID=C8W1Q8_DESAS|nr:hypothetical protein [Desulfofarcimen acetoxidans]ACV63529.1 hypothetical protein Dtox_2751 [Desulfofarcimen acetoxidans DSM 771]